MSNLQKFNQTINHAETQKYLEKVLGEKKTDFVANLTTIVANERNLQECDPVTLMYAGINATTLNLPLNKNLGFAYVIPYKSKDKAGNTITEAQFQVGYKGYIQLAIRSGQFETMNVSDVREGEIEDYNILTGEMKFKTIKNRQSLPVVGYVAYFRLTNGFWKMHYMTREEVDQHAHRWSKAYGKLWTSDFDAMALKTCLKLLLTKYAPMYAEMQTISTAIRYDQSVVRTQDNNPDYVDNAVVDADAVEVNVNENNVVTDILKAKSFDEVQSILDNVPDDIKSSERVQQAVNAKRVKS